MKLITGLIIAILLTSGYLINHWLNYGICHIIKNGIGAVALMFLGIAIKGEILIKCNSTELDTIPSNSVELKPKSLLQLFEEKWGYKNE